MAIATQAEPAQSALDLGASSINRRLQFFSIKSGRVLAASFAGHVFEITWIDDDDRRVWRARILSKQEGGMRIADHRLLPDLGAAKDYLEAEAIRLGGAS
jgi:hypothetical protein